MSKRKKTRKQLGYTYRELDNGRHQFRVANGTPKPTCRRFLDYNAGKDWAKDLVALYVDGHYAAHEKARKLKLHDALARYAAKVSKLKRSHRQEIGRIRTLQALPIAQKSLAELRSSDFDELITGWLLEKGPNGEKPLKPASVNRYLALLHHLWEKARTGWGLVTLANVIADVERPPEHNMRNRRLSRWEYVAIVRYARSHVRNPHWLHFFRLSIRCPQRKSELLARCWSDVDWKEGALKVPDGKTGYRISPLLPGAMKTLREMHAQFKPKPGDRIFPMSANSVDMIWKQVKQDLGLLDLHWHDLRHEGCSQAAKLVGYNITLLQKISGHKTLSQLNRYVHHSVDDVHEAVAERRERRKASTRQQAVDTQAIAAEVLKGLLQGLQGSPQALAIVQALLGAGALTQPKPGLRLVQGGLSASAPEGACPGEPSHSVEQPAKAKRPRDSSS